MYIYICVCVCVRIIIVHVWMDGCTVNFTVAVLTCMYMYMNIYTYHAGKCT